MAARMNGLLTLPSMKVITHSNMPPSQPGSNQSETREEETLIYSNGPPCHSIASLNPSCRSAELWNNKKNKVLQIARETTPNNVIDTIYYQ